MTSENFKIKKIINQPENILRIFLALVFLSAGIFRIANPIIAASEFSSLGLPSAFSIVTIIIELAAGLGLFFNKLTKYIYCLLVGFISFALIWALIINGQEIIKATNELFIFNLTSTDWFLHFIFLLIVITLIIKKDRR